MTRVAYLADARREHLDEEGGRWYAICRWHATLVSLETRAQAQADVNAANRHGSCAEWCEACQDYDDERGA